MCGRMTHYYTWEQIYNHYHAFTQALNLPARYNVAPTQDVLAITAEPEGKAARMMRWGLIPPWSAEPLKAATFNTRTDTIETSKLWKPSLEKWRCVVPASGWYEWTGDKGNKQPWHFTRPDGDVLSFAGLYAPPGRIGKASCSVIVTEAADSTRHIHDRMPVILERDQVERWLQEPDLTLLRPYSGEIVITPARKGPLGPGVVKNEGPELLIADGLVELPKGDFHD